MLRVARPSLWLARYIQIFCCMHVTVEVVCSGDVLPQMRHSVCLGTMTVLFIALFQCLIQCIVHSMNKITFRWMDAWMDGQIAFIECIFFLILKILFALCCLFFFEFELKYS